MQPKIVKGVFTSQTYIVDTSDGVILVDCGASPESVAEVIGSSKILAVLITHGHFDHVYYAKQYQDSGARLYIHADDADCLYTDNNLGRHMGRVVEPCRADYTVVDGEVINIADKKITVVHTAGHTKGGVCYSIGNCIFTGDTLFFHDYGRTDLIGGSEAELTASVRKLLKLDPKLVVHAGHGKSSTIAEEREYFEATIGKVDI